MTTKAIVKGVKTFTKSGATYSMTVQCITIIDANGLSYTDDVVATSTSFNPLLPNWKSRVRDAAVASALALYDLTVDEVLFPDFGVLGV